MLIGKTFEKAPHSAIELSIVIKAGVAFTEAYTLSCNYFATQV